MTAVSIAGVLGSGTLGVLVVGFFASTLLGTGSEPLFGVAILTVVGAGAATLVMRARA